MAGGEGIVFHRKCRQCGGRGVTERQLCQTCFGLGTVSYRRSKSAQDAAAKTSRRPDKNKTGPSTNFEEEAATKLVEAARCGRLTSEQLALLVHYHYGIFAKDQLAVLAATLARLTPRLIDPMVIHANTDGQD